MNKDIKIMIELQRFWQNILTEEKDIERNNKSIEYWRNDLKEKEAEIDTIKDEIKNLKSTIKTNELQLNELDLKVKKLENQRLSIGKEKELTAIDHEIETVNKGRGDIEEKLINDMDSLEEKENRHESLMNELEDSQKQVDNDISEIQKKIDKSESIIMENKEKYNELIDALNTRYSSKFDKMLKSKHGIAVAKVDNNVCSGCNFEIPASLAIEALKTDSITNCTNCGRFIYR